MSDEKRLIKHLLENYERVGIVGRPVYNTSETVRVSYGLALIQILDLDEKNQVLTTNVWSRYVSSTTSASGYSTSYQICVYKDWSILFTTWSVSRNPTSMKCLYLHMIQIYDDVIRNLRILWIYINTIIYNIIRPTWLRYKMTYIVNMTYCHPLFVIPPRSDFNESHTPTPISLFVHFRSVTNTPFVIISAGKHPYSVT